MSLRSGNIPSLIQGISQQPASLRLPTQLDLMENCYATVVEGLIRRAPTEYVSKISDTELESAFMHVINRDLTERYNAIVHNRDVQVFTVEGVEKTVTGILLDSTLALIVDAVANTTGTTFTIAADPGETAMDFVVAGLTAPNDASVLLQGSVDGAAWDTLSTRTTNGTTAGVSIGAYVYIRGKIQSYVAGTIDVSATYKRNTYLISSNPKEDFTALTVADFTFVVNKTITPTMKADLSTVRPAEGLVFVRQGNYASRYIVYIDGIIRADFTTSATVVGELATEFIADQLCDDLLAWSYGGSFTFTLQGSTIHIRKSASVDGTLRLLDNAVAISNGAAFLIDAASGETSIDFVVENLTTATVKLQSSADGVSWTDEATRTTNGTTNVLISDLVTDALYIRGIVTAWTAGTIDLSAVYKRDDFVLQTGDSQGGSSLKGFKDQTLRFTDLPTIAPTDFVIGIDANPDTMSGAYFLKAVSNQSGETFGEVTWQESVAPGIAYIIDPTTMPHALIRGGGGDFTFEALDWTNRICGDEETNPTPSFIGSPILDVGFYKNRLGFLADEFFIFSQTTEYFNFWRTTVTQILDTDPIDSRAVHTKVSILKHMVPFNTDLMLFADQTQFKIPGDVAFTPKTFRCDPAAEFEGNMVAKPVNAGKSLYFIFNREEFAGMKNLYQTESIANIMDAEDLTAHAPAYIPAGVFRIAHSTLEGVSCLLTDGKPSSIYVYKTAFNPGDNKKVQAAWFEWPMGDEDTVKVLDAGFIESILYLIVQRDGKVYQERMLLQPARVDVGVDYLTCLDQRFDDAFGTVAGTYDSGPNTTLFENLPYAPDADFVVTSKDGAVPQIIDSDADSIEVLGDWSTETMWFGRSYLSRWQPSTIYVRKPTASGGTVIDEVSRLQLKRGYLNYSDSGYFNVSVTPEGRDSSSYIFTGRLVGDLNELGEVALGSGRFSFAILSKNDRVILEISSETIQPFQLTSMEWEGEYTKRSGG